MTKEKEQRVKAKLELNSLKESLQKIK